MVFTDEMRKKAAETRERNRREKLEREAAKKAKAAADPEEESVTTPENTPRMPDGSVVRDPDEPAPLELSAAELARIRETAKKKVDAELAKSREAEREGLIAKALDAEILQQRKDAGLVDYRDDILDILIDVAPFAVDITIDGKVYQHGRWYPVDRRLYDTLTEIMARSWDSEDRAGNPNRRFRREVAGTMNPLANERRQADGSFTLGTVPNVNGRTGMVG